MQQILFITSLILFPFGLFAQHQKPVEHHIQTAHQIIKVDHNKTLILDFDSADIELKSTKGSRVIIEMTLKFDAPSSAVARFIMKQKRYEVSLTNDYNFQRLQPQKKGKLIVMGEDFEENISYTIYIPEKLHYYQSPALSLNDQIQ